MVRAHLQRFRVVAAMGAWVLGTGIWLSAQQPAAARPHAIVAELDGIIHPVAAEFFSDVILEADTSGADVVVLVLRTPGGLLESTRTIVSRMAPLSTRPC